jgi:hypothetical protein
LNKKINEKYILTIMTFSLTPVRLILEWTNSDKI